MEYKIKKGDKFLCLKDYVMEDGEVAYTKDRMYISEHDRMITDNENDVHHLMEGADNLFEYFELVVTNKNIGSVIKDLQTLILERFISEVKKEFPEQNFDYLDFIADRVISNEYNN